MHLFRKSFRDLPIAVRLGSLFGVLCITCFASQQWEGKGAPITVEGCAYSPGKNWLAYGLAALGAPRDIFIFDTRARVLVKKLAAHNAIVTSLTFDAQGKLLASGGEDGKVIVFDTDLWQPTAMITLKGSIHSLKFLPGNTQLVINDGHGIHVWDMLGSKCGKIISHASFTESEHMAVSNKGGHIAMFNWKKHRNEVWELDGSNQAKLIAVLALEAHEAVVADNAFVVGDRLVIIGNSAGEIKAWDWRERKIVSETTTKAEIAALIMWDNVVLYATRAKRTTKICTWSLLQKVALTTACEIRSPIVRFEVDAGLNWCFLGVIGHDYAPVLHSLPEEIKNKVGPLKMK